MILLFKQLIPQWLRLFLKRVQRRLFLLIDARKPYLRELRYQGFRVFYTPGAGLIERIRPGSFNRVYEPELCHAIVQTLQKENDPTFIDIGANIGLVSLTVLSQIPRVKIYAFEPGPHQHRLFDTTIFANQLGSQIELFGAALGEVTGNSEFFTFGAGDASGDGLRDTGRSGHPLKKISVPICTLDVWWHANGSPNIHVVKIDTEGAELLVLRGAEEFITHCKPEIYFELSPLNIQAYPYSASNVLEWFSVHGYEVYTLNEERCTLSNLQKCVLLTDTFYAKPIILM